MTLTNILDEKIFGEGATLITNPISFVNETTGEGILKAHLVVKHQNVAYAEIVAENALRDEWTIF